MNLETLYLFLALAVLTAMGIWVNIKASDNIIVALSALMVLPGVAGMVYLIAVALIA